MQQKPITDGSLTQMPPADAGAMHAAKAGTEQTVNAPPRSALYRDASMHESDAAGGLSRATSCSTLKGSVTLDSSKVLPRGCSADMGVQSVAMAVNDDWVTCQVAAQLSANWMSAAWCAPTKEQFKGLDTVSHCSGDWSSTTSVDDLPEDEDPEEEDAESILGDAFDFDKGWISTTPEPTVE